MDAESWIAAIFNCSDNKIEHDNKTFCYNSDTMVADICLYRDGVIITRVSFNLPIRMREICNYSEDDILDCCISLADHFQ